MIKVRHFLLAGGVVGAAILAFFGDKNPSNGVTEAITRSNSTSPLNTSNSDTKNSSPTETVSAPIARTNPSQKKKHDPYILALRPREDLIGIPQNTKSGSSIFGMQSWVPPPPPALPVAKPAPPAPPSAPVMPFSYLGKKNEDGQWEVYLGRGDETYIVHEQTVIEGNYRIDSIKPPQLTMTYLPLKQLQTLNVGSAE